MVDWTTLRDSLGLAVRPIDAWPGKLKSVWAREVGPFTANLSDTLRMLRCELGQLGARNIVLQVAFREKDLRLDGLPRAGAVAEHPGVILSFSCGGRYCRRSFDGFTKWEHNLRALAMNLYDLRHANLYGVESGDEQYKGWEALPPPRAATRQEMAAETLLHLAGFPAHEITPAAIKQMVERSDARGVVWRRVAMRCHPDQMGDADDFIRAKSAMETLSCQN